MYNFSVYGFEHHKLLTKQQTNTNVFPHNSHLNQYKNVRLLNQLKLDTHNPMFNIISGDSKWSLLILLANKLKYHGPEKSF